MRSQREKSSSRMIVRTGPAPKVELLRQPRGRIQPIADMRKTRLIVLCFAVSVILTVGIYVSGDRPHAPQTSAIMLETTAPEEPAETAAPWPSPAAPATQTVRTQLRLAADPGAVVDEIRQAPGGGTAEFDAKSSHLVITQSRHPAPPDP